MDYQSLKNELATDPLGRGYAGMDDGEAAEDLNLQYRTRIRQSMTASEVLNATNKSEFDGLSDSAKQIYWNLLHMGQLNPAGIEAAIMVDIFGGGSTTIVMLQAARLTPVSRAQELGLPTLKPFDVATARSI